LAFLAGHGEVQIKPSASFYCVKYWEIIADNLSKAGWSCVSAIDCEGRTIWIVDAHRGNGSLSLGEGMKN
jgi:hypothetical protein